MKIEEGTVMTFKLNSGEELIAKVTKAPDEEGWLMLEEPVSIAPGPQGMGLVPSMFTANTKEEIRLNTKSISLYGVTEDNVRMKYLEATTGIQVPSKKLVLG